MICQYCGPNCSTCTAIGCDCYSTSCVCSSESLHVTHAKSIDLDFPGFGNLRKDTFGYRGRELGRRQLDLYGFGKLMKEERLVEKREERLIEKREERPVEKSHRVVETGYDPNLLINRILISDKIIKYFRAAKIPKGKACIYSREFENNFKDIRKIGKGSFGTIFSSVIKVTPKLAVPVAIKQARLFIEEIDTLNDFSYPKEYIINKMVNNILKSGTCPNFNFTYSIMFCDRCFITDIKTCSLTLNELQDTDMYSNLSTKDSALNTKIQMSALFQILAAVHTIHTVYGIYHGDIKGNNILIKKIPYNPNECWLYTLNDEDFFVSNAGIVCFLSDFGLSTNLTPAQRDTSYYGVRNAEIVSTSKGLKFLPFTTLWFPTKGSGKPFLIPSPRIKGTTSLTVNRFIKGLNSIPSTNVDLNNTKRFPPYEFFKDIQNVFKIFVGRRRLPGLSPKVKKLAKSNIFPDIKTDTVWSDKSVLHFSADRVIGKNFSGKYLEGNAIVIEAYKLPFVSGNYRSVQK